MRKEWTIVWLPMLFTLAYGREDIPSDNINALWIWIALFGMAAVGVLILFVSSLQRKKIGKVYENILDRQLEMEKEQALFLSNISENIYDMVTKTLKKKEEEPENTKESAVQTADTKEDIEDKLLAVTTDLLVFLQLKSDKVHIENAKFNLNNVLNEVSGYICNKYKGSRVDLIFDINNNVPRLLVGDSLRLGQVLNSVLEYMMSRLNTEELRLEIEMFTTYEENLELQFQFTDTGKGLSREEIATLFDPYYDEENSSYMGLGLFISHELVKMMGGELTIWSHAGKGTSFTMTLPFELYDKHNKRMYRLPEKTLTTKKVFIVENNYNAALAIKKTFAYFRHEVRVMSKEVFLQQMPNLAPYDIVVLYHSVFSHKLVNYLGKIKNNKDLKVISVNSLLHVDEAHFSDEIIDVDLYTPLNQERIFEMIVNMYNITVPDTAEENTWEVKALKTYKSEIQESRGISQSSFTDFRGRHILIVEDNVINQKVLSALLVPAGVKVSIANNGQKAVDMIKERKVTFDLVLMDINMPVLDGYSATELIRKDHDFDRLPIVAFTALVLDSEIEKMYACGLNAFLAKPLNIGKLYTALAMFLSKNGATHTASNIPAVPRADQMLLKGLDIRKGIEYANRSDVLYREVLHEFFEAYGNSDLLFKKLVEEYRYEQIKMLCIDMRGLTGAIGAYDMLEVVNRIHQAILYRNFGLLTDYIEEYHRELSVLKKAIEEYLSPSAQKAA
ncbi:hypothetical protein YH65_08980 [Sulfurovum lithotrophicum]|uniref:histidine kinase n=1 Tax=Sulfurovum lithotrophicum TaxID=206403 RepID=A0A7U4M2G8_9BACT|nr:response regulator [Sulfurovum lithotrophicum]AKF25489.1 hypothetical protein YH65_08980 [Sulfurovum lithotrophicum]